MGRIWAPLPLFRVLCAQGLKAQEEEKATYVTKATSKAVWALTGNVITEFKGSVPMYRMAEIVSEILFVKLYRIQGNPEERQRKE